jgi:hypothetical protein
MNTQPTRRVARAVTTALLAAGMMATTAPAAQAGDSADRKGTTRVAVAPAVVTKLDRLGLAAAPTKGATAVPFEGTVALRFPVTDVEKNGNKIKHRGGVRVSSGHDAIALKRFTVKLGTSKVGAAVSVNGDKVGRVEVLNIRKSNRAALGPVRLTLTRTAAKAINATFGAPAFSAGDNFGFAKIRLR